MLLVFWIVSSKWSVMVLINVSSHLLIALSHDTTNFGFITMGLVVILSLAGIFPLCVALVRDSLWLFALSRVSINLV